ncbi:MgtC/SapB family protein [Wenzhouxiangella marina]|nr:MgtC/SapB family protein [Wenzhouxiangella marina]MBB6086856.1 uncharacterized membrane protein (DUF4010 family) [Wenzhouxiangella marina]
MESGLDWVYRLGVALAIGMMIGSERGWQRREASEGQRSAGLRTFALFGLLGGLSGLLARDFGLLPAAVMFLGLSLLMASMHLAHAREDHDLGATTEVAGLITFLLGLLAGLGELAIASATGVITVVVLASKHQMHGWLARLSRPELVAALKLLVISVVLLPLLPNQGYGPWGSLNPYVIWWMVVLIASISFVGYFAVRLAGARAGIAFTALFGGLASSTAVAMHLSRLSASGQARPRLLAGGILLACGTMYLRLLIVASIVEFGLFRALVMPAAVMAVLVLGAAAWLIGRSGREESAGPIHQSNPLELGSALVFGLLLALVMLLGQALTHWLGDAGVYLLAAASGVADVDAITLSLSRMAGEGLSIEVATLGILIAAAVNSMVKASISLSIGGRRSGLPVMLVLALASIAGLLIAWLDGSLI